MQPLRHQPLPTSKALPKSKATANIDAARAQGKLNNPNVYSPYGTQTVSYDGDQPTITQAFSPDQQAIYDQCNATKLQLSQLSGQGAQRPPRRGRQARGFRRGSSCPWRLLVHAQPDHRRHDGASERGLRQGARPERNPTSLLRASAPAPKPTTTRCSCSQRGLNDAGTQAAVNSGVLTSQAYQMDMDRRKQAITEQLAQASNSAQRNHGADVGLASLQPLLHTRLCPERASRRRAGLCRATGYQPMGSRQ